MSNVIEFPTDRLEISKKDAEELLYHKKHRYVEQQCEWYGEKIMFILHKQGFDIDDPQFIEDFVFVMEAFKSCLLRNLDLKHPLHKIQDKLNELLEEDS